MNDFLRWLNNCGYTEEKGVEHRECIGYKRYIIRTEILHKYNAKVQDGEYTKLDKREIKNCTIITLGNDQGYSGFFVSFFFNVEGNLVYHGVWE